MDLKYDMCHLQSADNIASNQRLNSANDEVNDGHNPDEFPILVLHDYSIASSGDVHTNDAYQSPVEREAPHGSRIVEVCSLSATHGKWPVQ
jgi:hypothetical protein